MEEAVGFVHFAGWFFSWWGFIQGMIIGGAITLLGSLALAPVIYRTRRRRELRRMWRMDQPRPMPVGLMPIWGDYDSENSSVDRRCVCHGRRVFEGERVLLWPEMGPLGALHTTVYCESVKESV